MQTATADRPGDVLSSDNLLLLQKEVYRDSGIVLDDSKLYLLETRLAPILEEQQLRTLNDLCALLRATGGATLRQKVIEAMTTNETLFFRDEPAFLALKKSVLPELIERRRSERKLSIWSAASSTGQEAYSLAMILDQMNLVGWDLRILGTDLNSQVVERARAARYRKFEISRGLPAEYLERYFEQQGNEWQVSDTIRKMVQFAQFDLRGSTAAFGRFDLVLCRNVLIYFDIDTKKSILKEIRGSLQQKGYLLLGCAESTLNLDNAFEKRLIDQATFYQAP
ncbi:MAG: protein-glutamate O-methyltransferase CheR [Bryobacteraceae bacterium]|nr:protein-glutamate O-methyltransferase CheR [Bryobacteraceae bacterium]